MFRIPTHSRRGMAVIKFGPAIADARGSVGGTVFSRNAAGAYMKQRTVPTYPASGRQTNIAALLSTVIDDWKTSLTTAQRAAWNSLAANTSLPNKLGEQFSPSGLNLFVKANMILDLCEEAHVVTPPVAAVAPSPQLTLAHVVATGIQVTAIGNWDETAAVDVMIQYLLNGPLSQNYYKGPYPASHAWPVAGFGALPLTIVGSGSLAINSRSHFRVRAVHADGAVSAPGYYFCDVGAVV